MTDTKTDTPVNGESSKQVVSEAEVNEILNEETENKPSAAPRKKRRAGPWLFLILIFIGLPAAWLLSPPELRQQVYDGLESIQEGKPIPVPSQAHLPESPTANQPTGPAQQGETPGNTAPQPVTQADTPAEQGAMTETGNDTPAPGESTEQPAAETTSPVHVDQGVPQDNTAALQDEIDRLQAELNSLRSEQETLTQRLNAPPIIEPRVWLGLLASPDTRLSQRIDMWTYLASRPALNGDRRKQAKDMASLLKKDLQQVITLRQRLENMAAAIPAAEPRDLIPSPESPYFAWLSNTFHLRHAPGPAEQKQGAMRKRLLDMAHALEIGDWPQGQAWRDLLDAARELPGNRIADGSAADLSDALEGISRDVDTSRKQAREWMEAL